MSTMPIVTEGTTARITLGELVTRHPAAARVLHRLGLDFCCSGQKTLGRACAEAGLRPEGVLAEVALEARNGTKPPEQPVRWDERPVADLVAHIVQFYHGPLRWELPRLIQLAGRVAHVHGDRAGFPSGLRHLLEQIREGVELHLDKEEQILFPLIRAGHGALAHLPVQVMIHEHQDHAFQLDRLHTLIAGLETPPWACTSWRELYQGMQQLELSLKEHIHLENNVLFPRVLVEETDAPPVRLLTR